MGPKTETSPGKGTQAKTANPANVEAVVVQQGGGGGPSGTPIVGGTSKGVLGNQALASVEAQFPNPLTPDCKGHRTSKMSNKFVR